MARLHCRTDRPPVRLVHPPTPSVSLFFSCTHSCQLPIYGSAASSGSTNPNARRHSRTCFATQRSSYMMSTTTKSFLATNCPEHHPGFSKQLCHSRCHKARRPHQGSRRASPSTLDREPRQVTPHEEGSAIPPPPIHHPPRPRPKPKTPPPRNTPCHSCENSSTSTSRLRLALY